MKKNYGKSIKESWNKIPGAGKTFIILGVLLGAGLVTYFTLGPYVQSYFQSIYQPQTGTTFSLSIKDGMTKEVLDKSDFDCTLYGTNTPSDWIDYETIDGVNDLSDIGAEDLTGYSYYIVRYNGSFTIPSTDDGDEEMDATMYERWAQLLPNASNTLTAYRQPSAAGFVVLNSETFIAVNTSAGILAQVNVTYVVASNVTETSNAWVKGFNYESYEYDRPYIVVNFNTTVTLDTYVISGTSRTRYNSTAIMYSFDIISSTPQTFYGRWGEDAADFQIDNTELYFGDTLLADSP